MKKGYDKKAKILKEPELTEDLKESTKLLQDAWPWKSRIRLRHVQSAYCELQKFLSLARNGFPPTTSVRSSCLPELSYETSRKLADKYEKKNGEKDEEEEEEEEDKDNGSSRRRLRQDPKPQLNILTAMVCIITGFLGAGKTTLLNHILNQQGETVRHQGHCVRPKLGGVDTGARVAVFVNEFGSVDIDGDLIRWQGKIDEARVVTLDNGCMCCEVNADLQRQLRKILEAQKKAPEKLDLLVIETSGLCDPAPVLSTLEQLDDLAVSLHLDTAHLSE
eukprot:g18778.t1